MSIMEYIISAGRCLSASKMRTFLTTLGIIVGISSVILINTIGSTIGNTIESTINNMIDGNELIVAIVRNDAFSTGFLDSDTYFDSDMIEKYEELTGGEARRMVTDTLCQAVMTGTEKNTKSISLCGFSENTSAALGADIIEGRYLSKDDEIKERAVAVISAKDADLIFGEGNSAVGQQISITAEYGVLISATVIGTYKTKTEDSPLQSMMGGEDYPTEVILPYTYLHKVMDYDTASNMECFIVSKDADADRLSELAKECFGQYINENEMIYTESLTDDLSMIDTVVGVITTIVAAIAAVSLLVGGIGVMNIMLVSVTERTMEIGVRKAMGADNKSIRIQFITESVIISLIGSVIGIVLGLVEAKLLALIAVKVTASMSLPISVNLGIPVKAIVASVIFSFIVGLVFGVYPANKAAKMEVVDALRYE